MKRQKNRPFGITMLYWVFLLGGALLFPGILFAQSKTISPDSAAILLSEQLKHFPQEKVYVQTDKPNYLPGERMWLRAHLIDALNNRPTFMSRYVYVELFTPANELTNQIQIRQDTMGVYAGYFDLDDRLPEGNYTIRAYTRYMRNRGNDTFFRKTVRVAKPHPVEMEFLPEFSFQGDTVEVDFHFMDRKNGNTIVPAEVHIQFEGDPLRAIKRKKGKFKGTFSLAGKESRSFRLDIYRQTTKGNRQKHSLFYTIPYPEGELDVSFHPEGGWLIPGRACRVGFKCINPSGLGEEVSGTLFNSRNEEVVQFSSLKLGMGFFDFIPVVGEKYHAVCQTEDGHARQFDLPDPDSCATTLNVRQLRDHFMVRVLRGESYRSGSLSLLIHHKGGVLYHESCSPEFDNHAFPKEFFPSGISSILLLDANRDIISERLVFNINEIDFADIKVGSSAPVYGCRELVTLTLQMDESTALLANNIAVSVTDKRIVFSDTVNSLVSTLLLSSELKGHIESPAGYFTDRKEERNALDVLMLTQGWRRYDIPSVLKGRIEEPSILPEQFMVISGRVEPQTPRKVQGDTVTLTMTFNWEDPDETGTVKKESKSKRSTFFVTGLQRTTTADRQGRFSFNVEYPYDPKCDHLGGATVLSVLSSSSGERKEENYVFLDSIIYRDCRFGMLPEARLLKSDNRSGMDSILEQSGRASPLKINKLEEVEGRFLVGEQKNRYPIIYPFGFQPLGYLRPVEFYSPKYETPEEVGSPTPDQRTTVYWNPGIQFSPAGEAVVEFYSADIPTTYRVEGEGVTTSGKLVHFTKDIVIGDSTLSASKLAAGISGSQASMKNPIEGSLDIRELNPDNIKSIQKGAIIYGKEREDGMIPVVKEEKNKNPIIFLDGEKISPKELERIKIRDIDLVTIIKDKTAIEIYGDEGTNGVIEVRTKSERAGPLVFQDGKRVPSGKLRHIRPWERVFFGWNLVKPSPIFTARGITRNME